MKMRHLMKKVQFDFGVDENGLYVGEDDDDWDDEDDEDFEDDVR